jgi:hypothetical protein
MAQGTVANWANALGVHIHQGNPPDWSPDQLLEPPTGIKSVAARLTSLEHACKAIDIVYGTTPDWENIRKELAALKLTLALHGYAPPADLLTDSEIQKVVRDLRLGDIARMEGEQFVRTATEFIVNHRHLSTKPEFPFKSVTGCVIEGVVRTPVDRVTDGFDVRGLTASGAKVEVTVSERDVQKCVDRRRLEADRNQRMQHELDAMRYNYKPDEFLGQPSVNDMAKSLMNAWKPH